MLVLRSLAFNILFYANTLAFLLVGTIPLLLLPRDAMMRAGIAWADVSLWLMRVVVGTRYEVEGVEHIPPGGIIVASKHQSVWETFALVTVFRRPVYILKRELTWIPLFGWWMQKLRMIPVNRGARARALKEATRRARQVVGVEGRQLLIFPEGTRRPAGAPPAYKYGIVHIYRELDVPCVPVALNAGVYWPRRKFLRHPGTIRITIMPPIQPGLDPDAFFATLQDRIETESDRLLELAIAETGVVLANRPETASS